MSDRVPPKCAEDILKETTHVNTIESYLIENEPEFRRLHALREEGWRNPDADHFYRAKRNRADNADGRGRAYLYKMSKSIARQMHWQTDIFAHMNRALFICMAPGGYTRNFLDHQPDSMVRGITLPVADGGHPMILPFGEDDPRVNIEFMDVTMLIDEFSDGSAALPVDRLGTAAFSHARPFQGHSFELVVCDGQVLRTHVRDECRQNTEPSRLLTAQLILGMQRLTQGGNLVLLLHKVEEWDTVKILQEFCSFAEVQLFKPWPMHAKHSSFYLVAKNVQPHSSAAVAAVKRWKALWWSETFDQNWYTEEQRDLDARVADIRQTLVEFGEELRRLGRNIWKIQREALEKADYTK